MPSRSPNSADISPNRLHSKGFDNRVATLGLVTIVAALGTSISNVALPEIATAFNVSMSTTQWVTLAYLLSTTVLIVPVGRLADGVGRAQLMTVGLVVFLVGSVIASLAPNLASLVAARAIQGVGAAAMASLPIALVRETVAPERIGRTMGLLGSAMAAGMAAGPALGGVLVAGPGWRLAYAVLAALAGLAVVLSLGSLSVRRSTGARRKSDPLGLALSAIALGSYAAAITLRPGGWIGIVGLLLLSAAAAIAFVWSQNHVAAPMIDIGVLRSPGVGRGLMGAFAAAAIMMTFTVIPPFLLTRGLGLEDNWMGLVMAIGPVAAIASGVPAGRLVDRRGAGQLTVAGLALITIGSVALALLPSWLGVVGFMAAAVILTPGNQLFMAANNTSVMSGADTAHQGVLAGLLNLARNTGFITGTAFAAAIFDVVADSGSGSSAAIHGSQAAFGAAALLGVLALVLISRTDRIGSARRREASASHAHT